MAVCGLCDPVLDGPGADEGQQFPEDGDALGVQDLAEHESAGPAAGRQDRGEERSAHVRKAGQFTELADSIRAAWFIDEHDEPGKAGRERATAGRETQEAKADRRQAAAAPGPFRLTFRSRRLSRIVTCWRHAG